MSFEEIEEKYNLLINIAKEEMLSIKDNEHDIHHMEDVVNFTKEILEKMKLQDVNREVCIIGAYWHDVGRTKLNDGHEKVSANMLKEQMEKMNYDEDFISKCIRVIEFHRWDMNPETIEGKIVKDADKLAWIGSGRWKACIKYKQRLDSIMDKLYMLRNEILYFDCSREIYDKQIIIILKILYENIYKE